MGGWDEIKRWRRQERARPIAQRRAIRQDDRRRLQPLILKLVDEHFPEQITQVGYLRARRYRAVEGSPTYMSR